MIRTFKEFARDKQLNERLFANIQPGYGSQPTPVYINPTISDVEAIIASAPRIRGFDKGEHIFIWDEDKGSHQMISNALGDYDDELKGQPDICFYLSVQTRNPLQLNLAYSSFTGKSTQNRLEGGSMGHLQQLLKNPVMQKLQPVIENYDEIINWIPRGVYSNPNVSGNDEPFSWPATNTQPTEQPRLANLPHYLTAANKASDPWDDFFHPKPAQKQNPYKWKGGLHRVGD